MTITATNTSAILAAPTNSNPPYFNRALSALGAVALISLVSTATIFGFITYRLITWRRHYRTFIGRNQYIVLIYNLSFADLVQSFAFTISWHWYQKENIDSNSSWCFAQGFLINFGDVASAFFVLAIGLHTWYRVIRNREVSYRFFLGLIGLTWCLASLLTVLAPILRGRHVYTQLYYWCWIPQQFDSERLALHYVWVFIVEFGSFLIYIWIFLHLLTYLRQSNLQTVGASQANAKRVVWASRAMLAYPVVYTFFTIPLASIRMATYAGHNVPPEYSIFAGCFFMSGGWANAVTYTLTRRILLRGEISTSSGPFQSIGRNSSKSGTKKSSRFQRSFSAVDKVMSAEHTSNDDLQTKRSGHNGTVSVTRASASDEIDLRQFDEHTLNSHGSPRMQSPVPAYNTNGIAEEEYPQRHSFSTPHTTFNRNLHRNVEAGRLTPLALNADGIVVTNDVRIASVRHNGIRARSPDEIWLD